MASASTGGVPEEMTSVWRLLNFPPIPEVPEPLRGKSFTAIEAIYCGDPVDGEELVGPLREFGSVAMDSVAVQPPAGIAELHMDPPEPVPYWGDSILIGELPAAAIDSLLEAVGPGSGSQLLSVELRHCGGALSRTSPGRRCARHAAWFILRVRCWFCSGARSDGADPGLGGLLQGGTRAL